MEPSSAPPSCSTKVSVTNAPHGTDGSIVNVKSPVAGWPPDTTFPNDRGAEGSITPPVLSRRTVKDCVSRGPVFRSEIL